MYNSSGGSSHDPRSKLGVPMWDRPMKPTSSLCGACKAHSNPDKQKSFKYLLSVSTGDYLVCRRCDGGPK